MTLNSYYKFFFDVFKILFRDYFEKDEYFRNLFYSQMNKIYEHNDIFYIFKSVKKDQKNDLVMKCVFTFILIIVLIWFAVQPDKINFNLNTTKICSTKKIPKNVNNFLTHLTHFFIHNQFVNLIKAATIFTDLMTLNNVNVPFNINLLYNALFQCIVILNEHYFINKVEAQNHFNLFSNIQQIISSKKVMELTPELYDQSSYLGIKNIEILINKYENKIVTQCFILFILLMSIVLFLTLKGKFCYSIICKQFQISNNNFSGAKLQRHHIIPKHCKGSNQESNIVLVSRELHALLHFIRFLNYLCFPYEYFNLHSFYSLLKGRAKQKKLQNKTGL